MPTVLCDRHRFAFLHIPKTGGTTVGHQLADALPHDRFLAAGFSLGTEVGEVYHDHLTLRQLSTLRPDLFRRLADCDVVAVLREPLSRLRSALYQYIRNSGPEEPGLLDRRAIGAVMDRVMRQVRQSANWPLPFNFFRPQVEYVRLDGRRYVGRTYDFADLAPMADHVRARTGVELDLGERRRGSRHYDPAQRRTLGSALRALRWVLPAAAHDALRARALRAIEQPSNPAMDAVLRSDTVREFVRDFYAEDAILYDDMRHGAQGNG